MAPKLKFKAKRRSGPDSESHLTQGWVRKLTSSETSRGYLFLTKAKYRNEFIDSGDFILKFDGLEFIHRSLDSSGRTTIPRAFLRRYAPGTKIKTRIVSRKEVEVTICAH